MFQEMSSDFSDPVSRYLDHYCAFSVNPLSAGVPLLGNQAWMAGLDKKWVIKAERSDVRMLNVYDNRGGFDADELLVGLSNIFQGNITVLLLSGADLNITKKGLGAVSAKGGYIIVQRPETSLYPGPLEEILSLDLEGATAVPEDMAVLLNKKISRSN
jgi:chemotaxis response regulator CheB